MVGIVLGRGSVARGAQGPILPAGIAAQALGLACKVAGAATMSGDETSPLHFGVSLAKP